MWRAIGRPQGNSTRRHGKIGGPDADPHRRNAPKPPNVRRRWSFRLLLVSFVPNGGSRLSSLRASAAMAQVVGSRLVLVVAFSVSRFLRRAAFAVVSFVRFVWIPCGVGIGLSALVYVLIARGVSIVQIVGYRLAYVMVLRIWPWSICLCGGFVSFPLASEPRVG